MARPSDPTIRPRLLIAAAALLADGGAEALSIRKVAAEVGTSTMAVYTHFGSKDDLISGVVIEAFDRLAAGLAAVPETDDPVTDAQALGRAYREMAVENANLYRVMFGRNPLGLSDPGSVLDGSAELFDPAAAGVDAFGLIVRAVQRCIDADLFDGDAITIARSLWAVSHGCVMLELSGLLGDDGAAVFDTTTAAVAAGFVRR